MLGIELEDCLEGFGRALMVEVLLVVHACHAFIERDLLTRRDGQIDLCLQHLQELAVAPGARQDAVHAPQRVDEARIFHEDIAVGLFRSV